MKKPIRKDEFALFCFAHKMINNTNSLHPSGCNGSLTIIVHAIIIIIIVRIIILMLENIAVLPELLRHDNLHTRSDTTTRSLLVSPRWCNGERSYILIGHIITRLFLRQKYEPYTTTITLASTYRYLKFISP